MLAVMEEAEKQKMTLTSGYIRNMALELAKQLGIENFNASQGWLQVQKSVNRLKPKKTVFWLPDDSQFQINLIIKNSESFGITVLMPEQSHLFNAYAII